MRPDAETEAESNETMVGKDFSGCAQYALEGTPAEIEVTLEVLTIQRVRRR
jgi:hypothetical protein